MTTSRTLGELRMEYLDNANQLYSQGQYDGCEAFIDSFLLTIPEETPVSKEIENRFKEAEGRIQKTINELIKNTEKMEITERSETVFYGKKASEIQALKDKMDACWQIAIKHGLFND